MPRSEVLTHQGKIADACLSCVHTELVGSWTCVCWLANRTNTHTCMIVPPLPERMPCDLLHQKCEPGLGSVLVTSVAGA